MIQHAGGWWVRRLRPTRFRALTPFGKVAVVLACTFAAAGVTEATRLVLERRDARGLRREVQQRLDAHDYVGARRALESLAGSSPGGLSQADRWDLAEPVRRGLERLSRGLRGEVLEHRRAGRVDAALARLHEMERLGLEPDWTGYAEAEVLRDAGRLEAAGDAYVAYAERFPTSSLCDDALYWGGLARLGTRRVEDARRLWLRLVHSYAGSSWRPEAERLLERTAPSAALDPGG